MHQFFVLLAFFGFAYGTYAVFAIGWHSQTLTQEIERETEKARVIAAKPGMQGAIHRVFGPLHWFVTFPLKSPGAALFLAVLMAVPALVI